MSIDPTKTIVNGASVHNNIMFTLYFREIIFPCHWSMDGHDL